MTLHDKTFDNLILYFVQFLNTVFRNGETHIKAILHYVIKVSAHIPVSMTP